MLTARLITTRASLCADLRQRRGLLRRSRSLRQEETQGRRLLFLLRSILWCGRGWRRGRWRRRGHGNTQLLPLLINMLLQLTQRFPHLLAFFWILDLWTGASGLQWAFWITLFWGFALLFHALAWFVDGRQLERRRTQHYLERQHQSTQ